MTDKKTLIGHFFCEQAVPLFRDCTIIFLKEEARKKACKCYRNFRFVNFEQIRGTYNKNVRRGMFCTKKCIYKGNIWIFV